MSTAPVVLEPGTRIVTVKGAAWELVRPSPPRWGQGRVIFRCKGHNHWKDPETGKDHGFKPCGWTAARDLAGCWVVQKPGATDPASDRRRDAVSLGDAWVIRGHDGLLAFPCPGCTKGRAEGLAVDGVVTEHKCDARCLNARGHVCECACGGAHHGEAYLGITVAR